MIAGLEQHAFTKRITPNRGRQYRLLADADLIALVEDDDSEAFTTLYERHSRAAYSLAYKMAAEHGTAEDLVQEASWRLGGRRRATKPRRVASGRGCSP